MLPFASSRSCYPPQSALRFSYWKVEKGDGTITITVVILIALILAFLVTLTSGRKVDGNGGAGQPRPAARVPCPLCHSRLQPGERIHSLIYPGGEQRLVHILGCPRCYPANIKARRVCPICRKELPSDGFIIGRMWNSEGKQHLRITACTACKKRTLKV